MNSFAVKTYPFLIDVLVALVMLATLAFSWRIGRKESLVLEKGWAQIIGGFCLLLLGAVVDISDHFLLFGEVAPSGQSLVQPLVEKVVGLLGGFLLLSIGLRRWLPIIAARRRAEEELRTSNRALTAQAERDSVELSLKKLDLEREIRERRLAASELKRTEAILETIVSAAPFVLLATDTGGRITLTRGSALLATGISTEQLVGRTVWDLFPKDSRVIRDFKRAVDGERVVSTVKIEDVVFQYRHAPWRDEAGEVVGIITVAMDVTERELVQRELRRAMEAAEDANHAKSQFLAKMSHELRTPLNSVIGFANVLRKNKQQNLGPKDMQFLDRIRQNGEHLLQLINEILDLSRIEARRMELSLAAVDLSRLITETLEQVRPNLTDAVRIEADLPPDVSLFETDVIKLKQVLINLVSNALKFTREGLVTVRLEVDPQTTIPLRIEVSDTGIGIPPDRLDKIFEAFQQVDASASRQVGGTGLGLSISQALCRLLGCELAVESVLGEGSTFRIVLAPAGNRAELPALHNQARPAPGGPAPKGPATEAETGLHG